MKTIILCEGTTDLLMIQFVLQYKYDWQYKSYVENKEKNRLVKRTLVRENDFVDTISCGGINNIPIQVKKLKELMFNATKEQEIPSKLIMMIDHDTIHSNQEFIEQLVRETEEPIETFSMNSWNNWKVDNLIGLTIEPLLYIACIPKEAVGAIESIMLKALATDAIEEAIVTKTDSFIRNIASTQDRYLQKASRISKAVFNTYFSIRTPEEKYDERAKVIKAYNWKENEVLNSSFQFLNI